MFLVSIQGLWKSLQLLLSSCWQMNQQTDSVSHCGRVVLFWVFVLWLPVLFWKVTLLSFQVNCSSSCVIRLIASPDSWLYPPVPLYPHVSYSLCLPLSCSTVHPSPLPQSLSRPSLDLLVGNSVFFCLFKSDFLFDNFIVQLCLSI